MVYGRLDSFFSLKSRTFLYTIVDRVTGFLGILANKLKDVVDENLDRIHFNLRVLFAFFSETRKRTNSFQTVFLCRRSSSSSAGFYPSGGPFVVISPSSGLFL